MQKNKKYYDDFFTKYPINIHDNPNRFIAVSNLLFGRVLDVACGTGTLANYYKGCYMGIDISDVAINKARASRRSKINFKVADLTKPFNEDIGKFDSVHIGEFLEHIKKDEIVFDNILKYCKKGARIVITVPNADRVPDESHCRTFTVPQIRREYSRYGKVVFHNWSGFEKRILFSIELGAPDVDEMSLVMIAKNEAKGIEKSIISALPLVNKVIVSIDSKTTDETEKIASLYADEIKHHVWQDDFSKARNEAQEGVKSKWILFLDGHEYIDKMGNIKEYLKYDVDGIFVTIQMESKMTFLFPRIYKSHIKFKNKIHNLNECKTKRACKDFVIIHDRINLQDPKSAEIRNKQRDELLPKQMLEDLKNNPKNPRAHFHLANYYMMRKEVNSAIKHYKKNIKYTASLDEKFLSLLHLGALRVSKGRNFFALMSFKSAEKLMPERWEVHRVIGGFWYFQKHWEKALPYLVQSLTPNKRRYSYEPMQPAFSETWDMIGQCFAQTDNNVEAITAWKRAKELATDERKKQFLDQKIKLVESLNLKEEKGKV